MTGDDMNDEEPEPDPEFQDISDDELKSRIRSLDEREHAVSRERRALQSELDRLRAELVSRIRANDQRRQGPDLNDELNNLFGDGSTGVREPRRPTPGSGADGIELDQPKQDHPDDETRPG